MWLNRVCAQISSQTSSHAIPLPPPPLLSGPVTAGVIGYHGSVCAGPAVDQSRQSCPAPPLFSPALHLCPIHSPTSAACRMPRTRPARHRCTAATRRPPSTGCRATKARRMHSALTNQPTSGWLLSLPRPPPPPLSVSPPALAAAHDCVLLCCRMCLSLK